MTGHLTFQKRAAPFPKRSARPAPAEGATRIALSRSACSATVFLISVLIPLATVAAPLPPPRPRGHAPVPSPPPAPAQQAPAQPSPAASPLDEECLANLQKLGFDAEPVDAPKAVAPECVIDKPVRLRSFRVGAGPVRDIAFPDGPIVACRFAQRFGTWVGDLAAVLVRGQLGTDLK